MIVAFLFFSGLIGYEIGLSENDMYVSDIARDCRSRVTHGYVQGWDDGADEATHYFEGHPERCKAEAPVFK